MPAGEKLSEKRVNIREGWALEWPATCNLKVKHRPSGSPITVYSLMGTLQTCILGAQRAPLFIPSAMMWEMTVDVERGQIAVFAAASRRPLRSAF